MSSHLVYVKRLDDKKVETKKECKERFIREKARQGVSYQEFLMLIPEVTVSTEFGSSMSQKARK